MIAGVFIFITNIKLHSRVFAHQLWHSQIYKCICEKVARCEEISTLNMKIDAICEQITLNVTKLGSLNV